MPGRLFFFNGMKIHVRKYASIWTGSKWHLGRYRSNLHAILRTTKRQTFSPFHLETLQYLAIVVYEYQLPFLGAGELPVLSDFGLQQTSKNNLERQKHALETTQWTIYMDDVVAAFSGISTIFSTAIEFKDTLKER